MLTAPAARRDQGSWVRGWKKSRPRYYRMQGVVRNMTLLVQLRAQDRTCHLLNAITAAEGVRGGRRRFVSMSSEVYILCAKVFEGV